jgi:hypothetical protein
MTNPTDKFCVYCAHFRVDEAAKLCMRPGLPGNVDLVTGIMPTASAYGERARIVGHTKIDPNLWRTEYCGPEGKFWESKYSTYNT